MDYLNQKSGAVGGTGNKSQRQSVHDPEKSERLDSEKSGHIELQTQTPLVGANVLTPSSNTYNANQRVNTQPYTSIYSDNADKLGTAKFPLIDTKNPY